MSNMKRITSSLVIVSVLICLLSGKVDAKGSDPIKLPPSPLKAVVLNCSFNSGWCTQDGTIRFIAEDPQLPVSFIAGVKNGVDFSCEGTQCSLPLSIGENFIVYWSISPFGKLSEKKILSIGLHFPEPRSIIRQGISSEQNASGRSLSLSVGEQTAFSQYKTVINPNSMLVHPDQHKTLKTVSWQAHPAKTDTDVTSQITWGIERSDSENIYKTLFEAKIFISPFMLAADAADLQNTLNEKVIVPQHADLSALHAFSADLSKKVVFIASMQQAKVAKKFPSTLLNKEEYLFTLDDSSPKVTIEKQKNIQGRISFEGELYEDVSNISSLSMNFGQGWVPVPYGRNRWKTTWDTESAGISGDDYWVQLRCIDLAGNVTIHEQKVTVINRMWPVLALFFLIISLGVLTLFDPRHKSWVNLAHSLSTCLAFQKLDSMEKDK